MAWSTARKNRARDNAVRLGRMQAAVMGSRMFPVAGVLVFFTGAVVAVEAVERLVDVLL